jgi:hypothetical protein
MICEIGQVATKQSRKGKAKKKICRIDLEALEQVRAAILPTLHISL